MRTNAQPASTPRPSKKVAAKEAAVAALTAWADAESTAAYDVALHEAAGSFLLACANRRPTLLDPFQISLA